MHRCWRAMIGMIVRHLEGLINTKVKFLKACMADTFFHQITRSLFCIITVSWAWSLVIKFYLFQAPLSNFEVSKYRSFLWMATFTWKWGSCHMFFINYLWTETDKIAHNWPTIGLFLWKYCYVKPLLYGKIFPNNCHDVDVVCDSLTIVQRFQGEFTWICFQNDPFSTERKKNCGVYRLKQCVPFRLCRLLRPKSYIFATRVHRHFKNCIRFGCTRHTGTENESFTFSKRSICVWQRFRINTSFNSSWPQITQRNRWVFKRKRVCKRLHAACIMPHASSAATLHASSAATLTSESSAWIMPRTDNHIHQNDNCKGKL